MGKHTQYVSKPPKVTQSDYLSQGMNAWTHHTATNLVTVHSRFLPDMSNAFEIGGILNADKPGLATVKQKNYELWHCTPFP